MQRGACHLTWQGSFLALLCLGTQSRLPAYLEHTLINADAWERSIQAALQMAHTGQPPFM